MKKWFRKLSRSIRKLSLQQRYSILRHLLTFGGGILASTGVITATMYMEITGALLGVLGIVWGVSDKIGDDSGDIENPN